MRVEHAGPPVRPVDRPLDEALLLEPVDHRTDARAVERHALRQGVLVEAGRVVQMHHHPEFQGAKSRAGLDLGERRRGQSGTAGARGAIGERATRSRFAGDFVILMIVRILNIIILNVSAGVNQT